MQTITPQARELNETLAADNPSVLAMLSRRGRGMFFPAKGILGQSAEAKGSAINATIGTALDDDGSPMRLGCVAKHIDLSPEDVFPYAPSYGNTAFRQVWRDHVYAKNPSLGDTPISLPVVTNAITHGLSICGYLFADPGDRLYKPDLSWGNYRLIFANTYDVECMMYTTFAGAQFNIDGLRDALLGGAPGKRLVLLNFPNNPSGYGVTPDEGRRIRDVLVQAADAGNEIVALIDDAYFGLFYEDGLLTESIFAQLADAHERILAVKVDGATKEDYAWGLRIGFVTFAGRGLTAASMRALEAKASGAIRGTISNACHLSQSLMHAAYHAPEYDRQKREKYATLRRRYETIRAIFAAHPEYAEAFTPLPFNAGYFMCVRPRADAETVRRILLRDFSTGTIATSDVIRIAYSSVPLTQLSRLFDNLYRACLQAAAATSS